MGHIGERLGAWFLTSNGLTVIEQNVPVGRGEVDLIANDGSTRVVIEVRSVTSGGDPLDAIDADKRRQVSSLARDLGVDRVDYLGVGFGSQFVDFHWVPGSS